MIPKYPFQVHVDYKFGLKVVRKTHNYERLGSAQVFAEAMFRKPDVRRVTVLMILDETTKGDT